MIRTRRPRLPLRTSPRRQSRRPRRVAACGFLLSPWEGGPDLDAARELISVLERRQDKTEGRRTPREEQVLSQVLYELRLAYVAHTPKGAP